MLENNLKISKRIAEKLLEKHKVTTTEVFECFLNRTKGLLEDTRVDKPIRQLSGLLQKQIPAVCLK